MPWWEVANHLRARYKLVAEGSSWVGMDWTFTHARLVITQRVKVEQSGEWIVVLAAVCKADKIDAPAALRFNGRLTIGALAVVDELCYLRATLPLDGLSPAHLDRTIEVIAREAARLRDPGESPEPQRLFTAYED